MKEIELVNFLDLTYDEKKMVLDWRNNVNIRKWMYNQNIIELKDHLTFIDNLKTKKDCKYFLVKEYGVAIGVINFTQIIKGESLHMGIYTNPNMKGKGKVLLEEIINYTFDILGIKKIVSEVFFKNLKAYNLYLNYNFKKKSIKMVNEEEIICMELINENR